MPNILVQEGELKVLGTAIVIFQKKNERLDILDDSKSFQKYVAKNKYTGLK